MNADRLIRMAINMLMRHGLKRFTKGQKPSPGAKRAGQSMRAMNKIRRM
ncbi:MAG: hypothetical protein QNJ20_02760 [Paracoccaceae bacterium]|nr:hypothetical protein [Paracoccaceae bacterium]